MEYITSYYSNEILLYISKYEAILIPGNVGMGECSLDWIFSKKNRDRPFCYLMGAVIPNS